MVHQAKVLTVSDSVANGDATDRSGDALEEQLSGAGFEVTERAVVADGVDAVADALRSLSNGFAGLVVTTGGTGFGLRDCTPEASLLVIERLAPGMSEAMRLVNPKGRLSRGVAGAVGACLVLNTPGSPAGATECLAAVLDVVGHALELLGGHQPHPHPPAAGS